LLREQILTSEVLHGVAVETHVLLQVFKHVLPELIATEFERGSLLVATGAAGGLVTPPAVWGVETVEPVEIEFAVAA